MVTVRPIIEINTTWELEFWPRRRISILEKQNSPGQAASDEGGRYETRQPEAIRADPGQRGAGPDRFSGGCAGTCVDAGDTEEARAARNAGEAVRGAAAAGRGAQARAKA